MKRQAKGPTFQTLFSGANAEALKERDKREGIHRKCSVCGSARACRHRRAVNMQRSTREKRRSISDNQWNTQSEQSFNGGRVLRQANWDVANVVEPMIAFTGINNSKENNPLQHDGGATGKRKNEPATKSLSPEEASDHYSSDSFEEPVSSPGELSQTQAGAGTGLISGDVLHTVPSLPTLDTGKDKHESVSASAREVVESLPRMPPIPGALSARATAQDENSFPESCSTSLSVTLPEVNLKSHKHHGVEKDSTLLVSQHELLPSKIENILELGYVEASPREEALIERDGHVFHEGVDRTFRTPVLPRGRELKFYILSTWGDPHYVGLNGIDLFDESGKRILLDASCISADPPDINVLPGYGSDPRTVDKLVDGCHYTCDDLHMWLSPFNLKEEQTITVRTPETKTISMIRIWNYNKSRIHSFRGVRQLRLFLDGEEIFGGEIKRAPGAMFAKELCSEVIFFTTNDKVLAEIAKDDPRISPEASAHQEEANGLMRDRLDEMRSLRPKTAEETPQDTGAIKDQSAGTMTHEQTTLPLVSPLLCLNAIEAESSNKATAKESFAMDGAPSISRKMVINLTATWGGEFYLGLSGMCLLVRKTLNDPNLEEFYPPIDSLRAEPADINIMGHKGDPRTLDKLINGVNVTIEDTDMWLIPFTKGGSHTIEIELPKNAGIIAGLRVWNYNKSEEDTRRGARIAHVEIDGERISPASGFIFRKATGNEDFDYGQTILFDGSQDFRLRAKPLERPSPIPMQDWEVPILPCGFILRFDFSETHGDRFYLGLNGIEIFDETGVLVPLRPRQVHAVPHSVNVLDTTPGTDVRVPQNLVNGVNHRTSSGYAWLAPLGMSLDPSCINKVYVVLEKPVVISAVRVWNYSANPERGASEVTLWLDGLMLYKGGLCQYSPQTPHHTIVFDSARQGNSGQDAQSYCGNRVQEVLMINDRQVVSDSRSSEKTVMESVPFDAGTRPQTAATAELLSQLHK